MRRLIFVYCMSTIMCMDVSPGVAGPLLVDWVFNDNGNIFAADDAGGQADGYLPANYNTTQFDWDKGLGTISVSFDIAGTYSFLIFFDHEIVRENNTFLNEYGDIQGTPNTGQSWEIDEPGWVFGDIFDNVQRGQLDNTNAVPTGLEDDVSLAMGWNFVLSNGMIALISLSLSERIPSEFYLGQHDPDGSHYLSSSLTIKDSSLPVPEPDSALLFIVGLTGWLGGHACFRSRQTARGPFQAANAFSIQND